MVVSRHESPLVASVAARQPLLVLLLEGLSAVQDKEACECVRALHGDCTVSSDLTS